MLGFISEGNLDNNASWLNVGMYNPPVEEIDGKIFYVLQIKTVMELAIGLYNRSINYNPIDRRHYVGTAFNMELPKIKENGELNYANIDNVLDIYCKRGVLPAGNYIIKEDVDV